jgi:cytochrome c-type biogenesis protein CcmH/NrfF
MTRTFRGLQLILVMALALFSTGASDVSARYNALGHKMMCICGCNQVLIECNHVGCQDSRRMLAELQMNLSNGDSDIPILRKFQAEYGAIAMAAPMFTRFNNTVWIAPPLFLLIGIAIILVLVLRWRSPAISVTSANNVSDLTEIRNHIRKETEL